MAASGLAPPLQFSNLALSTNQFSLELYHNIISSKPQGKNVFFSPFSITAALAMVTVGTGGSTRDQLLNTLHLKKDYSDSITLNSAFNQLFSALNVQTNASSSPQKLTTTTPSNRNCFNCGKPNEPMQLSVANKVYIQQGFSVKPGYGESLEASYHTTFGTADFANKPDAAKLDINNWVSSVTNEKIKELFSSFDPSTLFVLVSAVYFKARWSVPFQVGNTFEKDFTLSTGQTTKAKFMGSYAWTAYADFPEFKAAGIMLPYSNNDFHMLIILPNAKNGMKDLEKVITTNIFDVTRYKQGWNDGFEVDLSLPKFKVEDSYELKSHLNDLGIRDLFIGNADLKGISDQPLIVSSVIHKTFVNVNEQGTEAAAATAVMMAGSALTPLEKQKVFNVDHPFLFAIQQKSSGLIMFFGKVEVPTA